MFRKVRTDAERFHAKVEKRDDGCWKWAGALNKSGAGLFYFQGRASLAHRAACHIYGKPIQSWHCVIHSCRKTWCVNPDHLHPVMRSDASQQYASMPPEPGLVRVMRRVEGKRYSVIAWVTPQKAAALRKKEQNKKKSRQRLCHCCGALISVRFTTKKFCSAPCRLSAYAHLKRVHQERACLRCHNPVPFNPGASYRAKYCSKECLHATQGETMAVVNPRRWSRIKRELQEGEA